ncbi:hypothetical protein SAMN02745866_00910 [Alteromonadaceae bacterium Bs31]|nr:hypothetical protein SAMN02745866_00910 [Alteromonadaceae bacterium Bs31]
MESTIEDQIPIQIFKAMVLAYDVFKSKKIEESDYYISYLEHNGTAIFIFSQKTLNNKTRGNTTKELIFEVNVDLEKMKVVGSSFAR